MVDGDAGQRGDDGISDGGRVEGIGVADWKQQACDPGERRDVRRADRVDGDMRMRSGIARFDGIGVRGRLEVRITDR